MTDETHENENTMSDTDEQSPELYAINRFNTILVRIDNLTKRIDSLEATMGKAQHEHTQTLRTIMVGWNAFLKSADAQLKVLFRGNIPAPIKKRLIETAFKGMEDMERKGK
jgi:hypothetical protein